MYEDYGPSSIAATMRSKGFDVLLLSEQETSVSFQEIIDFKPFIIGFSVYKVSKESVYRVCRRLKSLPAGCHFHCRRYLPQLQPYRDFTRVS